jgi:SAM-dependent methyltransferase
MLSVRRRSEAPVGRPRDFLDGEIFEPQLVELYQSIPFQDYVSKDNLPIPSNQDREGYYGERHLEYWLSGLYDYLGTIGSLQNGSIKDRRLLDFGGATGRVSRHFYCQGRCTDIFLCDVNINHVDWLVEHFPEDFKVFKNTALPNLPLPDASIDLAIAFSVFTHMDFYELAWLMELRRILRPGGILYVTVHNDDTWNILPSTWVYQVLMQSREFRTRYVPGSPLTERFAVRYSEEDAYNCNTFHPNTYIRRVWGRMFSVSEILPLRHSYQSGVVLKNDLR